MKILIFLLIACVIAIFFEIALIVTTIITSCKHNNKVTRTIYTAATCETTAEFCEDCGLQLTTSTTDCR